MPVSPLGSIVTTLYVDVAVELMVEVDEHTGSEQEVQLIELDLQLPIPGPLQLVQDRPQTPLTDASCT